MLTGNESTQWRELPDRYPPFQTCHHRFQQWVRSGKLEKALRLLATRLHDRGKLDLQEAFIDATFASAKKGVLRLAQHAEARGQRFSLSPLITVFHSAYPFRVLLRTSHNWWKRFWQEASSMNSQRDSLATEHTTLTHSTKGSKQNYDIELIAPHRGQRRVRTLDGRKLRRYNRRWHVERLFAWLHCFRRLVTRYEYHIENFLGFVHLACTVLLLKHLSDAKC